MVEKVLELLMLVFWIGLGLGALSAVVPALAPLAYWVAWASGNAVALLALAATLFVVLSTLPRLARGRT